MGFVPSPLIGDFGFISIGTYLDLSWKKIEEEGEIKGLGLEFGEGAVKGGSGFVSMLEEFKGGTAGRE